MNVGPEEYKKTEERMSFSYSDVEACVHISIWLHKHNN
jgi:hypothetical protein